MKKFAAILLVSCICTVRAMAGTDLVAYFNYATFNIPAKGPYVETYISVFGNTVAYKKMPSGKFQAQVEISMLFTQNDSIKASQKYILSSPEITDTSAKSTVNFVDLKRVSLKVGLYKLEISIRDKNRDQKPFTGTQDIIVSFPGDRVTFSDIELVESYSKTATQTVLTKNGIDIIPYTSNFYPDNLSKLSFYAEVYNAKALLGDSSKFVISYYIESYEQRKKLDKYSKFSIQKSGPVNILLSEFDITDLPTGNYNVVMEVRDKTNALVTDRKVFFQRYNPHGKFDTQDISSLTVSNTFVASITSADTLRDYIRSLRPIATEGEKLFMDNQLMGGSLELMQQFFLSFWVTRDNVTPEQSWKRYHGEVVKVNKAFSTTAFRGYDTDRGRVWLQYGAPDQRTVVENEPNSYPYEIWQYYRLKPQNQTNKKFVFFNEDLASNDYKLMHSDARGEVYDANWQMKLQKRTVQSNNMDITKPGIDHYGNNVDENFKNPR